MGLKVIDEKAFLRDYAKGKGTYMLAPKYGVSSTTLANILIKNGVKPRGKRVRVISEDEVSKLIIKQKVARDAMLNYLGFKDHLAKWWFNEYMPMEEAARKYGVSPLTFRRTLKGYGVEYPKVPARTMAMLKRRYG